MSANFVHLKIHTEYSMIDGLVRIKPLVERIKALGMTAVAVTDHANLFALVKFYKASLAAGVKPIVGADVCLKEGDDFFTATLLCQNNIGYKNLTELLSRGYLEGQMMDGRPTVQWEWIEQAQEGLIALSGGRQGDIGQALLNGKKRIANTCLQRWKKIFPDRFYLELQRTHREQEKEYLHAAVSLAEQFEIPVVATNDVRFLKSDDFEAHEARVCIHAGYVLDDAKRPHEYSEQQYLRSADEMAELFSDIPEALENTVEIAKRCTLTLSLGNPCLPQFPIPEGQSLEGYFRAVSEEGLEKRFLQHGEPKDKAAYFDRLNLEVDVIVKMGFPGYFLIVADFIGWAKEHDIPVGPGRGSGAGSIIAYALGITELDPLHFELLFERFLNAERVSMPDFDIDFCMERRDEVIEYVAERYGRDAVSQIITYGTMAAKAVVRDVGRVLGMSYGHVDKIAKMIPFELGITLDKALEQEEALAERYRDEEEVTTLIDLARRLEGIVRNAGKHAGGVVIAPTKLTDFTPVYCEYGGGNLVTQFDKNDVEAAGLVKFDFLGLRTLTIIHWAVQAVNKRLSAKKEPLLDISKIPLDDRQTFELLKSCATTAVFQLESRGMKELIRRLKPDFFEEIIALVALFRPGPLQSGMVDDFIDRKHGRATVHYPHPDLEEILKPTYGVILYQEQVMKIAQVLAGYSLGGADILRSAMGKKKPEEMAKQRIVFTEGAVKRGIENEVAEYIFDLMEKFAGYGFNRSHSAAYALIAYQTAWLKAHYPAEFMAAVLSSDMDNTDKVVSFLDECTSMSLTVLSPDVNVGHYPFVVNEKDEIEYGLGAIKGVGEAAVLHIVEEREANGAYQSLFDFCCRLDTRKVNRRVLDPLIRSGAMDGFKQERSVLMASVNNALKAAEQASHNTLVGQNDLFGDAAQEGPPEEYYVKAEAWEEQTRLEGEKETLGYYLSGHPWEAYEQELKTLITASIGELQTVRKKTAVIAGLVVSLRHLQTRTGKRMAVMTLEDHTGRVEVTLFSRLFEERYADLAKDQIMIISGNIEDDDYTGGVRIIAEDLYTIDQLREKRAKRLVLKVASQQQVETLLAQLPNLIQPYQGGECPISIAYHSEQAGAELLLGETWRINPKETLLALLRKLCGKESVVMEY